MMEQGPVYEMERNHHFQQLMIHAQDLKKLSAPVYDVEKDHHFQDLITHAYELKQVWPLTQFFLFPLCKKSIICLEGKSMTPHQGNTFLFRSS